jgi:hypothetical protein
VQGDVGSFHVEHRHFVLVLHQHLAVPLRFTVRGSGFRVQSWGLSLMGSGFREESVEFM